MSTIKEIAQLAGVSRGTVDRVLNGRGGVNRQTAGKILEIAESLQYSPNRLGKRLAIRKKQLRFGCVLFSGKNKNPYMEEIASSIKRRGVSLEEYGILMEIRYADLGNPASLLQAIDELEKSGIHGLVLTPVESMALVEKINTLWESGIPTVALDSDLYPSARLAYVGSDSYSGGQTAANLMALFTSQHSNTGIVLGSWSVKNHTQRVDGFSDYFNSNCSDMHIVDIVENHDDDDESYRNVRSMLVRHHEIDSLFLAAAGIEGACKAVMELGKKIHIISFDTAPFTKKMLQTEIISATIGQQPEFQGKKALDILLDYLGMGIPPAREHYYPKTEIFIRTNIL